MNLLEFYAEIFKAVKQSHTAEFSLQIANEAIETILKIFPDAIKILDVKTTGFEVKE